MPLAPKSSALGLAIYKGSWSAQQVKHLLNRTMFGAKASDIDYFASKGLNASVDELLNVQASIIPAPLNDYNSTSFTDPNVPLGKTWINDISTDGTINTYRRSSYKKWLLSIWVGQERNIREILRNNCTGNFKQMVRAVTTDPAMLRYLNGYLNTKSAPDENYGRELQELYTVGKDGGAKYMEEDVKAAAKVLTGWRIDANFNPVFDSTRHDTSNKIFSAFYNNTVITGKTAANGALETDEMLTMIFQKPEVAKFICRKLYRYFVYYAIDDVVEKNIITPLANAFIANNFEIKPVLKLLFSSEHFYDALYIGCQIKSPVDHVVGFLRQYEITIPNAVSDYADAYFLYNNMVNQLNNMGQNPVDPPNVSGWPAYYQAPDYN